jgi:hypothetical protein
LVFRIELLWARRSPTALSSFRSPRKASEDVKLDEVVSHVQKLALAGL